MTVRIRRKLGAASLAAPIHLVFLVALGLLLAACGDGSGDADRDEATGTPTTAGEPEQSGDPIVAPRSEDTPAPATTVVREAAVQLPAGLAQLAEVWETDFGTRTIDLNELALGIPARDPRDLIRPIDAPVFMLVDEAGGWLEDREPGVLVEIDGIARFYPLSILTRHEIVNDRFGDIPVAVTYCPLCNTALTFDRRVGDDTLRFGVSGLLRNSDLVMWDDVTQSLWQQITGEAIVGSLAGTSLRPIGSAIVRWADFATSHADGEAMGPDQGFGIPYGTNPYVGYSSRSAPYPFFEGEIDDRFPALERVIGVTLDDSHKAYPFSLLSQDRVVNDEVAGIPIVVVWGAEDTADALDSGSIPRGQSVGTGIAYFAEVDGTALTFADAGEDRLTDVETGSTWTLLGEAIDGPLAGSQLEFAPHRNEFWFAWQAFFPGAPVYGG
jgi:hypothetical protein